MLLAIFIFAILTTSVSTMEDTTYFTNMNGVKLSEEQYTNLLRAFDHDTINTLEQSTIDIYKNEENLSKTEEVKYVKVTEVERVDKVHSRTEETISKEQYEKELKMPDGMARAASGFIEATDTVRTSYKTVTLNVVIVVQFQ